MELPAHNIGTTIKFIREAKNIKQYVLQNALNSSCNLSKIETNKAQPSLATFHELLQLLNISPDEFSILHAIHDPHPKSYYESITNHLSCNAVRIDRQYLETALIILANYADAPLNNFKTLKFKLLYHQLSCFYYLNFECDMQQAKAHSFVLLEYYKTKINVPLLSDLKLLTMILPFVSLKEGQNLLDDFNYFQSLDRQPFCSVQTIYLRTSLTFSKKCLLERDEQLFAKTLESISFLLPTLLYIDVCSEFLILKGIQLYDFKNEQAQGEQFIDRGLKLAKEFNLPHIYSAWKRYCEHVYQIK